MSYVTDQEILLEILKAIDYKDDKDAFVKEFAEIVNIQALENLISALPQDQQEALKNELAANKDNPKKASELLKARFGDEQMQKALEDSSKNAMMSWMQAINPTLSDEQTQNLINLSQELNPTPSPSPAA